MTDFLLEREKISNELENLSSWHRIAFAASCCERMFPNYVAFSRAEQWGDGDLLRIALDETWESLQLKSFDTSRINQLFSSCKEIIPDTEDFDSEYTSAALNASCAVAETLEGLINKKVETLVDVAFLAKETVYMYSQGWGGVEAYDPKIEEIINNHPFMISELKKQHDDLELLKVTPDLNATFIQLFRENAKIEGKSSIGL